MRELTMQALPYKGERHEKAWGHELWIINNEFYCGKLLVFNFFSMEYDNNLALFIMSILLIGILLTIVTMKFSLA